MKDPERVHMGNQFENTTKQHSIKSDIKIVIANNKRNWSLVLGLCIITSILLATLDFTKTGIFFGKLSVDTPNEILDYYREQFVTSLHDISAGRFFYYSIVKGICFVIPIFTIMICEMVIHTKIHHRIIASLFFVTVCVTLFTVMTFIVGTTLTFEYMSRLNESGVFSSDFGMEHSPLVMLQLFLLSLLWAWLWCISALMILNNCIYELRAIAGVLVVYLTPTLLNIPVSIQSLFLEPAYYIVNQVLSIEHLLISSVMHPLYYVGVMATTFVVIVVYAFYQESLSYI